MSYLYITNNYFYDFNLILIAYYLQSLIFSPCESISHSTVFSIFHVLKW